MLWCHCRHLCHLPPRTPSAAFLSWRLCVLVLQRARRGPVPAPDVGPESAVPRLRCPSLQHFREHFLAPGRPVILEGVADHWPCMKKWRWVLTAAPCPQATHTSPSPHRHFTSSPGIDGQEAGGESGAARCAPSRAVTASVADSQDLRDSYTSSGPEAKPTTTQGQPLPRFLARR